MVRKVGRGSMRTSIAVTSRKEWAKRSNGATGKPRQERFLFVRSSVRPFARSLLSTVGFTLLELSLVLFIIGLLVTVLLPRFGDFGSAQLESSTRRLAALVRYLNGEAAFTGQVYRIRYDLDEQTYAVQMLVP